jgi:hypothetical protein
VIVESHGPTYRGIDKVKRWVRVWIQSEGKVSRWDIASFHFAGDTAAYEWVFECTAKKKSSYIEGMSVVHFNGNKISYIREYRMTRPSFEWDEKEIAD